MYQSARIAECILNECGSLSTMKLQKLVYYSQALHLVHYGEPLFVEDIEAWANGPVVRDLFNLHRRKFVITKGFFGDAAVGSLDESTAKSIRSVLDVLGGKTGAELSELTHSEAPWRDARKGYGPSERCDVVITPDAIRSFYSSPACQNPLFV